MLRLVLNITLLPFVCLSYNILVAQTDTLFLSIDRCRDMALNNNTKIKIAEYRTEAATEMRKSTHTKYFGEFSFAGQYQYSNRQISLFNQDLFLPVVPFWAIDENTGTLREDILENPLLNGIVSNPLTGEIFYDSQGNPAFWLYSYLPSEQLKFGTHHNFMFGPSFVQPLYLGGKIRNMVKVAEAGEEIMKAKQSMDEDDVMLQTEEAYWRCVCVQEQKVLAYRYRELLLLLVSDLENIHAEGIITYNDVLKAKIKLNEADLNCLKADNGLALSQMALLQIIGLPLNTPIVLDGNIDKLPVLPNPSGSFETALQNREELRILDNTLSMAIAQKNIAMSRFLPNIMASANYLFVNPNPYNAFEKEFGSDWSAGITVQIPLFHWGDRLHTMRASKKIIEISQLMKQDAEEMIHLELEQSYFVYTETMKKFDLCEKTLIQATENLRLANDAFSEGMFTLSDLLEAQVLWQQAYSELIKAKTDLKLQEINYRKKTGQL